MKIILILALAFATPVLVLETGCTTAPAARTTEVTTLKIVGASAKASMDASAQLLKSGRLTVAQWTKIADYYDHVFQPAYALAVAAVGSDLSSVASPDIMALAIQLSGLVASATSVISP